MDIGLRNHASTDMQDWVKKEVGRKLMEHGNSKMKILGDTYFHYNGNEKDEASPVEDGEDDESTTTAAGRNAARRRRNNAAAGTGNAVEEDDPMDENDDLALMVS